MTQDKLNPVHPGEVLMEEFLKPMGISQNKLARSLGVPPRRINEIVLEKRSISADTALRLAHYFGTSAKFWMGLQSDYDLDIAKDKVGRRIQKEVGVYTARP
jgi:addiction module HigA family antidote